MINTAYITHSFCGLHNMGDYHPESPHRLAAINDRLIASGLINYLIPHEATEANIEHLERVHSQEFIQSIIAAAPKQGLHHIDDDTVMNSHSLQAALCGAGAGVMAVDLVMKQLANSVFCAVRPPGHHAEHHRAMGFCFFNNIAVAAAHALEHYQLERIAIIDFDVHHGNGTEDIFRHDTRVLYCSTFQHPFYPYSGSDTKNEHIFNYPLPAGSDGAYMQSIMTQNALPIIDEFAPQLILISAGFDAHKLDPLAHLRWVESDYVWLTQQLQALSFKHSDGRIVSMLEGGYDPDALGRSVNEHIRALLEG
ncbi:histone deacetylase family protein [Ferrovum sp. PN-J185]|uniref:histone deacetylase family protein n=1 Tax=Ferrovum sp. PN-J185 TaxID=1356306 RepID=UPI00079C4434|nr:histone deacetylase family protein [Ferrovum sp. PN-J185]KXW56698.1 histone deacetylase-like amidohydrolase [Ferrovum sp. PN-J185]MCC6067616.1 histone deacetylase family protein [Ferrovum sp. PN-J185]